MENDKSIFDYASQVFTVFGITLLILNIFCTLFGEDAAEISSIFRLGDQGISVDTALQFLAAIVLITLIRRLCFTDRLIKRMPLFLRTVCMVILVVMVIALFSYVFAWFPINSRRAWGMFFLCFFVCFALSMLLSILKAKAENRALEKALRRLQQEGKEEDHGAGD